MCPLGIKIRHFITLDDVKGYIHLLLSALLPLRLHLYKHHLK